MWVVTDATKHVVCRCGDIRHAECVAWIVGHGAAISVAITGLNVWREDGRTQPPTPREQHDWHLYRLAVLLARLDRLDPLPDGSRLPQ